MLQPTVIAKARKHNEGMTLLELMFAAGVTAMVLSLLFGSLVSVSVAGGVTANRGAAAAHLSSVMEELKTLSFNDLLIYQPPDFADLGPTEVIQVKCYYSDGTSIALPVDPATITTPLPNPLPVQCIVQWQDARGHWVVKTATQLFYR